eukprot:TRINITY_DN18633_c0_g1_i2.p1 TRINITY_DN18633_c0_g1~~TRINITY_DN18633_c0_g1_i2.p1  ORF type:complete len:177 (+),score=26.12 TRINITY_DN18633_c0_g1_i2:186-716(+)
MCIRDRLIMKAMWPIKRLLNYLCEKLCNGYVESNINFEKLDFKNGEITINDVLLSNEKINEQLIGFPYKIIRASIRELRISMPLPIFAENMKIVASDIDVLLMPISAKKCFTETFLNSTQKSMPVKREAPIVESEEEASLELPRDEDGLARAIKKLLANVECEVRNLAIRIIFFRL